MPKLAELAEVIKADLIGEPNAHISRARPFDLAAEGDVTLAASARYAARLNESHATAVIVSEPILGSSRNLLIARNPKLAFARAIEALHKTEYTFTGTSDDVVLGQGSVLGEEVSIHPRVIIGEDAVIGDRVTLYSGVVIGDRCSIGAETVIYPNVSIYHDCEIGCRVIIHAGTVIGADGFGFVADEHGRQVKMLQLGGAIDRGGFGDTVLRRGVKLDNLVQVGHNCDIGEDTVVAALAGFSGGTRIGRRCVIAGQVGTNQHITIGDGATITGQAGVTKNVREGGFMAGTPIQDYNAWRRSQVLYSKLPEMAERLKQLEMVVQKLAQPSEP